MQSWINDDENDNNDYDNGHDDDDDNDDENDDDDVSIMIQWGAPQFYSRLHSHLRWCVILQYNGDDNSEYYNSDGEKDVSSYITMVMKKGWLSYIIMVMAKRCSSYVTMLIMKNIFILHYNGDGDDNVHPTLQ